MLQRRGHAVLLNYLSRNSNSKSQCTLLPLCSSNSSFSSSTRQQSGFRDKVRGISPVGAPMRYLIPRWPLNDLSRFNFMHDIDREIETTRRRMENLFGSLFDYSYDSAVANLMPSPENEFIQTDDQGERHWRLVFDMKGFKADDIKIKYQKRNLILSGRNEKESEDDYFLSEFTQSYKLPDDLNVNDLESRLTDDGMLIVEAPLPKLLKESEKRQSLESKGDENVESKKKAKTIMIENLDKKDEESNEKSSSQSSV